MYEEMLSWLEALDGVEQDLRYHPEGDALFHSLQVFELALADEADPEMLTAALLHDIGKATSGRDHAIVGADLAEGVPDRSRWMIAHHLHLLRWPKRTRQQLAHTRELADLERLRRWDLGGRKRHARVRSPEEAVSIVIEALGLDAVDHGVGR